MFADPLNLIFLAIAVGAAYKLWQVLGQKPGVPASEPAPKLKIQPLPNDLELKAAAPPRNTWQGHAQEGSELAKNLQQIADRIQQFDSNEFLDRAKSAYESILNAFAAGNLEVLKAALTPKTFSVFENEIIRRKKEGLDSVFRFVSVKRTAIEHAALAGNTVHIEVAYTSLHFSALKNAAGEIVSGSDKQVAEVSELWTFERSLDESASTWRLSETHDLTDHA